MYLFAGTLAAFLTGCYSSTNLHTQGTLLETTRTDPKGSGNTRNKRDNQIDHKDWLRTRHTIRSIPNRTKSKGAPLNRLEITLRPSIPLPQDPFTPDSDSDLTNSEQNSSHPTNPKSHKHDSNRRDYLLQYSHRSLTLKLVVNPKRKHWITHRRRREKSEHNTE